MPLAAVLALYVPILLYAALALFLGKLVALATIVFGFGLLIFPYLMLEWIATPVVAAVMGFQARWGVAKALQFGLPLVILFTAVTPVISSGDATLAVPVPWLSVRPVGWAQVIPIVLERLSWWGSVYLVTLLAGLVSRKIKPIAAKSSPRILKEPA
jgi:hypothetical protein